MCSLSHNSVRVLFIYFNECLASVRSVSGLQRNQNQPHFVVCREIQESELQKFYSRLMKMLQGKDLGHDTVDSLQRLHLILSATKYTRT